MSKFAVLRKDENYSENYQWNVYYYGGDKGNHPIKFEEEKFIYTSQNYYEDILVELAEKGYIPQCQAKTIYFRFDSESKLKRYDDIFFIKQGFLSRFL